MATKLITINLMVDKSRNRVVFAESNIHFVEILLSFLTLPLGSIIRLTKKQPMGSLHKLFESVENIDSNCLVNEACRSMLLRPLKQCSALPIIYDDSSYALSHGYICSQRSCYDERLSLYANAQCSCGRAMDKRVRLASHAISLSVPKDNTAFVFIISDDLVISQSSTEKIIELLPTLGIEQLGGLESIHVDVTAEKIIELLKRLLVSDTPLTDVFLSGGQSENKMQSFKKSARQNFNEKVPPPTTSKRIPVKLLLNNDDNKLLFAEADEEFADLLVSFLTYPMSSVVNKLRGQSGIHCFDNLYKCIESLGSANCFKNNKLIEILLRPKLPPYSKLENQLIKLDELTVPEKYYMCRTALCDSDVVSSIANITCKGCWKITNKRLNLTNQKSCSRGFMMNSSFMVTDDLIIKKLSPVMVVNDFLKEYGRRIKAKNVEIGEDEALALLRACITTENVLTDALLGKKGGGERRWIRSY